MPRIGRNVTGVMPEPAAIQFVALLVTGRRSDTSPCWPSPPVRRLRRGRGAAPPQGSPGPGQGDIRTRSWEDQETGKRRYLTEILASRVEYIGGAGNGRQAFQQTAQPSTSGGNADPEF
jgi:hypothetical protein